MKKLILIPLLAGAVSVAHAQQDATIANMDRQAQERRVEANTQLTAGRIFVGGNGVLGFNTLGKTTIEQDGSSIDNDNNTSTFGLNLSGGYMISDQFALGLNLNVTSSSDESTNMNGVQNESNSTLFSIGPFARYYFPLSERLAVYPQASIGFGSQNTESGGVDSDASLFTYGLGVGAAYFIGDQVSIDLLLNYARNRSKFDNILLANGGTAEVTETRGQFGANIGFNIFF